MAMTVAGKNRIMIYGPKEDGTYVVEFKTAPGDALSAADPAACVLLAVDSPATEGGPGRCNCQFCRD